MNHPIQWQRVLLAGALAAPVCVIILLVLDYWLSTDHVMHLPGRFVALMTIPILYTPIYRWLGRRRAQETSVTDYKKQ